MAVTLASPLGSTPDEDAFQRRQALLREIHIKRLQEKLIKAMGEASGEVTSSDPAYFIDQLALSNVSAAELRLSQEFEGQKAQAESLFLNLNAALAAFN